MSIKKFYTGVYVGDNLGVGTTSPQEKLDISAGNIRLDDNQRISWSSSDSNIGRVRITGNESNDFITIATDNSERVRINNTGVGIGTTSPGEKLEVSGNIRFTSFYGDLQFGGIANQLSYNQWIASASGGMGIRNTAGYIYFTTAAGEVARVTSAGDVGIGTTSPAAKLDVVTTTFSNSFVDIQNLKYTTFDVLKFGYTGLTGSIRTGTIDTGIFGFAINTGDGTERMRIDTSGNVGIGTNDPDAKLHVKSSNSGATTQSGTLIVEAGSAPSIQILSANSQTQSIKFGDPQDGDAGRISYSHSTNDMTLVTNGGDRVTIDDTGNVGIGTTSPARQLTLSGNSSPIISLASNTTGGEPAIYFGDTADDNEGRIVYSNSQDAMQIWTAAAERIRVTNAGDTGIGVTTPRAKLDVAGGVKVADDTDAAVANKVGTLRYRYVPGSPKNFSYVDMCMQTGTNSYAWVNIVQNVWN